MIFQAQGHVDFQVQGNDEQAQSNGETFEEFSALLAQATNELQRIVQKHDQAFRLSMLTTLRVTEAYRLINLYGLGFTTTVAELIQNGCSAAQALLLATQGVGDDVLAMRRLVTHPDFSLTEFKTALQPEACRGCQHYYGRVDGMRRLICAMHPYGPETDNCEDWETIVHHS